MATAHHRNHVVYTSRGCGIVTSRCRVTAAQRYKSYRDAEMQRMGVSAVLLLTAVFRCNYAALSVWWCVQEACGGALHSNHVDWGRLPRRLANSNPLQTDPRSQIHLVCLLVGEISLPSHFQKIFSGRLAHASTHPSPRHGFAFAKRAGQRLR